MLYDDSFRFWELDGYLRRKGIGAAVRERILRLNPKGVEYGEQIRGWHPKETARLFHIDAIGVKRFIEIYGHAAYRSIPKNAWTKRGKRRYIHGLYVLQHGFVAR